MLFTSLRQLPLFSVYISLGIFLGIVYDIFYVFRLKRKSALIHISDVLFSVIFFISMLYTAKWFNNGETEIYFFFGIMLGFFAERKTLGKGIKILVDFFIKILYNLYIKLNIKKVVKFILK